MKKLLLPLCALALTGCGPSEPQDKLHLYIWADYLKPELITRFETENRCRVVLDTFDSNESMYAKLKAGAGGYDIAVPSSYMVKLMAQQDMLATFDRAQLPNLQHIDPDVLAMIHNREMNHSAPYAIGHTVIAYRKDRHPNLDATWATFDLPALKGRTTLLDDMRETLGAALKQLGHSINTRDEAQLAAARDLAIRWKRNSAKFENEQYKGGIDSGEFDAVMGYSGDLFQVVSENDKIGILVPREGVTMACDEFVILKTAPRSDLAHKFINFLHDPAVAAENMEWMGYLMPNTEAKKLMGKEFLEHPAIHLPKDVLPKSEVIEDLGADLAKFTKVWDEVKAGE
jgi:spermidine/putrescine transport system substrate-binding protein